MSSAKGFSDLPQSRSKSRANQSSIRPFTVLHVKDIDSTPSDIRVCTSIYVCLWAGQQVNAMRVGSEILFDLFLHHVTTNARALCILLILVLLEYEFSLNKNRKVLTGFGCHAQSSGDGEERRYLLPGYLYDKIALFTRSHRNRASSSWPVLPSHIRHIYILIFHAQPFNLCRWSDSLPVLENPRTSMWS